MSAPNQTAASGEAIWVLSGDFNGIEDHNRVVAASHIWEDGVPKGFQDLRQLGIGKGSKVKVVFENSHMYGVVEKIYATNHLADVRLDLDTFYEAEP